MYLWKFLVNLSKFLFVEILCICGDFMYIYGCCLLSCELLVCNCEDF